MDPISDFFIRIKNAEKAGHAAVRMPYSSLKNEIAEALHRNGWVGEVSRRGKRVKKILEIQLVKKENNSAIHRILFLSRPSRRRYAPYRELRPSPRGGIIILSTSRGIMSEKEARKAHVGGQLIAEIW